MKSIKILKLKSNNDENNGRWFRMQLKKRQQLFNINMTKVIFKVKLNRYLAVVIN